MNKKRSPLFRTIALVLGGGGLIVAGSLLSCMMPMMGMMGMGDKKDQGMMDQGHMKEMMQQMMGGILPPGIDPRDLPEPQSRGAKLLSTYCSQCHNLPSPRMHTAGDWHRVAGRMLTRERMMAGMRGMMMQVRAPSGQEEEVLLQYLKTHAMQALAPGAVPSPHSSGASLFQQTCSQCHALPDPKAACGIRMVSRRGADAAEYDCHGTKGDYRPRGQGNYGLFGACFSVIVSRNEEAID